MMTYIEQFKIWLIHYLGGVLPGDAAQELWKSLPLSVRLACQKACEKVRIDPSFKQPDGSNLGREIRRDEAGEWARLYLKGTQHRDSDINLACELYFYLYVRRG